MRSFLRAITEHIIAPSRITHELFMGLLTPFGRSPHMRRHIATVIIARVQLIGLLFAVLVPLWSVIDWWVFEPRDALALTGLRLASAAVFIALAWPRPMNLRNPYAQAAVMLLVLLMVPPLFYLISLEVIHTDTLSDSQKLVAQLYAYMPTIVLGGLAIFPLTALEIFVFSLPVVLTGVFGMLAGGEALSLEQHGAGLWFMLMMMGVAMFSGMSQSHYMESLVQKAMTDPLTGAYTRRSGIDALELSLRLCSLSGKPLTLVFVDLDHFKSVNDVYGHEAGDEVLRNAVTGIQRTLRRSDILIRWGGEEFVIVLPNMSADHFSGLYSRLSTQLGARPDGTPVTASMGIAESAQDHSASWKTLVEAADLRMYEAKKGGRNRAILPGGDILNP
jgi:diguanylate cyclase (GGDEF)-like protein